MEIGTCASLLQTVFFLDRCFNPVVSLVKKASSIHPNTVGNTLSIALITSIFFRATSFLTPALFLLKIMHMVAQVFSRVIASLDEKISTLLTRIKELTNKLETQVNLLSQRIEELEREVQRVANINASLEADLSRLQEQIEELTDANRTLSEQNQRLKQSIEDLDRTGEKMSGAVATLQELREELERIGKLIAEKNTALAATASRLEEMEAQEAALLVKLTNVANKEE